VYLVEDEIRRLLDAPDTTTAPGRRDRAILVTLAFTGLRLQELVGLDPTDVDFSRATLRVLGKGRKERLVPMNGSVVEALTCYLEDAGRVPAPGERALFLNRFGGRLTGRSVENIVAAHLRAAGLTRPGLSPHKLRHSFATLLHSRQVDLVDIQTLMGHASLASTQVYTHTDAERLRGAIEKIPTPKGLA
jgi:site-specific recombinase XerD